MIIIHRLDRLAAAVAAQPFDARARNSFAEALDAESRRDEAEWHRFRAFRGMALVYEDERFPDEWVVGWMDGPMWRLPARPDGWEARERVEYTFDERELLSWPYPPSAAAGCGVPW